MLRTSEVRTFSRKIIGCPRMTHNEASAIPQFQFTKNLNKFFLQSLRKILKIMSFKNKLFNLRKFLHYVKLRLIFF